MADRVPAPMRLDAKILATAAENHTEEHRGIGGLHPGRCWQWIADEYDRLARHGRSSDPIEEGRREAVRLCETLERLVETAQTIHGSGTNGEGWVAFQRAIQEARAVLDDVARHGRSSDPIEEGRRQAVREIRAEVGLDKGWEFRPAGLTDGATINPFDLDSILDRVAGLEGEGHSPIGSNASESPPTEPHRDYAGRTCTTGLLHDHGDASESGQPPEASDE